MMTVQVSVLHSIALAFTQKLWVKVKLI